MKNKLFALFLLSGFIAVQAEAPLSPKERKELMAKIRQEAICQGVLFNLYNFERLSKNNAILTEKELRLMARVNAAFKTFKCENYKDEAFKKFDIDGVMNLLDKIPTSELSIEDLENSKIIEHQFRSNLLNDKYRILLLQRRLGLTEKEWYALSSKCVAEFNNLVE